MYKASCFCVCVFYISNNECH